MMQRARQIVVVADQRKVSTDQFNYWSPTTGAVAVDHRRRRRPGRAGRAARDRGTDRSRPTPASPDRDRQLERQPAVTTTSDSVASAQSVPSHGPHAASGRAAPAQRSAGSRRYRSRRLNPATYFSEWTRRCCAAPTFASTKAASRRTSRSRPCWDTSSPAPWWTPNGPLPDGVAMGDQVAVYPLVTCGECAACRKGHENICRNRKAFGYQLTGGLSQFVRVPAVARQNLVPVPGVSAAEAAIIEPVACAYNGQKLAGMSRARDGTDRRLRATRPDPRRPGQELRRAEGRRRRSDRPTPDDGNPIRGRSGPGAWPGDRRCSSTSSATVASMYW